MTKPLITGETTVAELAELIARRFSQHETVVVKYDGRLWETWVGGNYQEAEGPTLAEALSALLAELPEVQR